MAPPAASRTAAETSISGKAPRSVRRPEVERRLVDAVRRLSADGASFAEISVSQLVREAGLARATFYLYFADRSAFVERLFDLTYQQTKATLARAWRCGATDRKELVSAITEFVDYYAENYPLISAVRVTAANDTVVADRLAAQMQSLVSQAESEIRAGQRHGVVPADLPPYETAAALVWMADQACYRLAGNPDPAARARLATAIASIGWNTLHS